MSLKFYDVEPIIKIITLVIAISTVFSGVYEIGYFSFIGIQISDFPIGISDLSKSIMQWMPYAVIIVLGLVTTSFVELKDKKFDEITGRLARIADGPLAMVPTEMASIKESLERYAFQSRIKSSIIIVAAGSIAMLTGFAIWFFDGLQSILVVSISLLFLSILQAFLLLTKLQSKIDEKVHLTSAGIIAVGLLVFAIGGITGENQLITPGDQTISIGGKEYPNVKIARTVEKGVLYIKDSRAQFVSWDRVDGLSYSTSAPKRMACSYNMCDRHIFEPSAR